MFETTASTASTTATTTSALPVASEQERQLALDKALRLVRATITVLDDESIPVLDWEYRDELIQNLREAVSELRKL